MIYSPEDRERVETAISLVSIKVTYDSIGRQYTHVENAGEVAQAILAILSSPMERGGGDHIASVAESGGTALPKSEGPNSAGWDGFPHMPAVGRRFIALYNDGSGANLFWRHDHGFIDADGDESDDGRDWDSYGLWSYLPDDLKFWCEIRDDDQMTLRLLPTESSTNSPIEASAGNIAGDDQTTSSILHRGQGDE